MLAIKIPTPIQSTKTTHIMNLSRLNALNCITNPNRSEVTTSTSVKRTKKAGSSLAN